MRLWIVLFYIIAGILFGFGGRRRRWGRRRYFFGNNSFYDYEADQIPISNEERPFYNWLQNRRRDSYVKKHGNLMKKADDIYKLYNTKVICECSIKNVTFKFTDLKNSKKSASAKMNMDYFDTIDCVNVLDSIIFSFDEYSDYDGIYKALHKSGYFLVESKYIPISKELRSREQKIITRKQSAPPLSERVNINKASEEELSKLPGVNIVRAKKLVQYRALHNGFKSEEEFIKIANVKPHFKEAIKNNIFLGIKMDNDNESGERIIDF